ncbi:MAG: tetratricopeptide repeat protein [Novosphingobium sp.]|nr:tetratricopeptide repeat protein [Novosphingobium sp.]
MTWLAVTLLAALAFAVLTLVLKVPRQGWTALGATLVMGLAGYAMQASPDQPGSPKAVEEAKPAFDAAQLTMRNKLADRSIPSQNRWIVISDAMARNGQYADAAQVLLGAVEDNPKDTEAWLALGNALLAHSQGVPTPASLYAYGRAEQASPDAPAPAFFMAVALTSGREPEKARKYWEKFIMQSPPDAPWMDELRAMANATPGSGSSQDVGERDKR